MSVLVTGVVGLSPGAVYATLAPFVDEILKEGNGSADALLGATLPTTPRQPKPTPTSPCMASPAATPAPGPAVGSMVYLQRLQQLSPLSRLTWKEPVAGVKNNGKLEVADKIFEAVRDGLESGAYTKVFLVLKGGVGSWTERLLWRTRSTCGMNRVAIISSDGRNAILKTHDRSTVKPLQGLGLAGFLDLHDLRVNGDAPAHGEEWLEGRVLSRAGSEFQLPTLLLHERKSFLYVAVDADTWVKNDENEYQVDFRGAVRRCMSLTIERGRVVVSVVRGSRSNKVLRRCGESGVHVFAHEPGKSPGEQIEALKGEIVSISRRSNPGEATPIRGRISSATPSLLSARVVVKDKSVLVSGISSLDSSVNLVALRSHSPEVLIAVFDEKTKSTQEAAFRLSQQARACSDRLRFLEFVPSDHMGSGVRAKLDELRGRYPGPWNINLTPGTKEQSIALIESARSNDRLWVFDERGVNIESIDDTQDPLPQKYPGLVPVASYLGGPLLSNGYRLKKENAIETGALAAAEAIFSHLADNRISLSYRKDHPPVWDNGRGKLNVTGLGCYDLKKLFSGFSFLDSAGRYDRNRWLEAMVGAFLISAGADEVICNLKWQWSDRPAGSFFKDELDIAAAFDTKTVAIDCKTGLQPNDRAKMKWNIDFVATAAFGHFAKPLLAVPFIDNAPPSTASQSRRGIEGCRTTFLDSRCLADPASFRSLLGLR